jgi:YspA, cpYpsA-related SLOG family
MSGVYLVLVCGGRDFTDNKAVFDFLDALHAERRITHIIHGDARGADTIADAWALSRGVQPVRCPALWKYNGPKAGPLRNEMMARLEPDVVVAFPGGVGTAHMCQVADEWGYKVIHCTPKEKN